jgi:uncharacterized SAM-binding protein YcdF (DUF218 family)
MGTQREQRLRVRTFIGAASLMGIAGYGGLMAFLNAYGQYDRARLAQAIVVLGAHVNEQGVPGPSLHARTLHAVQLYRRGLAPKIICTGGLGTYPPVEAKAAALLAIQHGVPTADVLLESESTSTWENVRNAAQICRAHGWHRLIVVSDAYHLWRVRRNFAAMGLEVFPSPAPNIEPWLRFQMTAREALVVARDLVLRPSTAP